jgi:sialic acid synthase SpsE
MTKIICEIGINHDGSYKKSQQLIDYAHEAGAWGVKFQYRNLKNYFLFKKKSNEIGKEIIDKQLKKNYLKPSSIKKLSNYAKQKKLKVGISFFNIKDLVDFKNYFFDFYKIPSASSFDFELIKKISNLNKKIFISLGGKSHKDIIKNRVNFLKILKKSNTTFLHCVSNYPLWPINSNLSSIANLKKTFNSFSIGYSSHEPDIYNCIIALSKGIDFIERHITVNKKSKGLDHTSSSDLDELKKLCYYSDNYRKINLNYKKFINQGERINMQNLSQSAYAKKNIYKNSKISIKDLYFSAPNIGLDKNNVSKYLNFKVLNDIKKNDLISFNHFIQEKQFSENFIFFCNKNKISLPVRPYDFDLINKIFKLNFYEFHLSYKDVNNFNYGGIKKNVFENKTITVHAPDYCDENDVIDIFSKNIKIKNKSKEIINKCIKICQFFQKLTGKRTLLIISFSSDNLNINKKLIYDQINAFVKNKFLKKKILILPQWLPPFAWYFGGAVVMNLFTDPKDLEYIKKIKLKICMDMSHLIMSKNYFSKNLKDIYLKYNNIFEHYHIADASGFDGEGLSIGSGDLLKDINVFKKIILLNKIKVLETWQGHLNKGSLFKKDIRKILKLTK